jgi:hypothetical protein
MTYTKRPYGTFCVKTRIADKKVLRKKTSQYRLSAMIFISFFCIYVPAFLFKTEAGFFESDNYFVSPFGADCDVQLNKNLFLDFINFLLLELLWH